MRRIPRWVGFIAAAFGCAASLMSVTAGHAYAATIYGHDCGEAGGGGTWETHGPMAAPCIASFTASRPGTAHIAIDITSTERGEVPHTWSFDIHKCGGKLLPSDPPRTFTCNFDPGKHTVYVDKMAAEKVHLKVDY